MYELRDQTLCAINSNGTITHRHNAIRTRIVQLLPVADNLMVLEDYYGFSQHFSNLYCLNSTSRSVWSAELPGATDGYVGPMEQRNGNISYNSWKGFRCTIDTSTGRILQRMFTK